MPDLPDLLSVLARQALVCEYATLTGDGRPVTWPVTPYPGEDGATVDVSTGLTYPAKAERARREPRVALLFSSTSDAELPGAPTVSVQGLATVRDSALQANTDRYLRQSLAKLPEAYKGMPPFLLRRLDWYLARIWVQVTPLRVLSWPSGRLDQRPESWQAPPGTAAPPSDPAPRGPSLPSRSEAPADWRPFADRADRLGVPVLTVVDADGWPLPVRCRSAERAADGYLLVPPTGVHLTGGPACITAHWHAPDMSQQENVVLLGTAEPADEGRVRVRVVRALRDWSLTGSRLGRTLGFLANGRTLRPRLQQEAMRRGQAPPAVNLPRS
ncbi:pyridoxamine 5'-phosphate oxidase family protein [Blastococcus sp. KM273129]|uniref:pyridoxamine 5'-phosphate oxidase family protein n=1 Tax=Blastococcus sp. KM273129 TaxID=2570315 RepID=UPI001F35D7AC|nr:pyridoxamine 5'-phosphate oxidase family protein [Blastococcus sp. KM273129]MCF6736836.1 hemerythrin [Blastococcus sp. KM273129]